MKKTAVQKKADKSVFNGYSAPKVSSNTKTKPVAAPAITKPSPKPLSKSHAMPLKLNENPNLHTDTLQGDTGHTHTHTHQPCFSYQCKISSECVCVASGIDNALKAMEITSGNRELDRHPERRQKAVRDGDGDGCDDGDGDGR